MILFPLPPKNDFTDISEDSYQQKKNIITKKSTGTHIPKNMLSPITRFNKGSLWITSTNTFTVMYT